MERVSDPKNSPEAKKHKKSTQIKVLNPLESISHRQIDSLLSQSETLHLHVKAGSGTSILEVSQVNFT